MKVTALTIPTTKLAGAHIQRSYTSVGVHAYSYTPKSMTLCPLIHKQILPTFVIVECAENGALQLHNANISGVLSICYNSTWRLVCDDEWDTFDAEFVCKQLGLEYEGITYTKM